MTTGSQGQWLGGEPSVIRLIQELCAQISSSPGPAAFATALILCTTVDSGACLFRSTCMFSIFIRFHVVEFTSVAHFVFVGIYACKCDWTNDGTVAASYIFLFHLCGLSMCQLG